jgi:translation initiation factor 1 (eIF-1/SUI1)
VAAREPSRLAFSSRAGGTIQDDAIEIQGDLGGRIRARLFGRRVRQKKVKRDVVFE